MDSVDGGPENLRMRIAIAIADLSCGLVDLWIFSFHVAGVRREA